MTARRAELPGKHPLLAAAPAPAPASYKLRRKSGKNPVTFFTTILTVSGMFAVFALPAYATQLGTVGVPTTSLASAPVAEQSITVSSDAAHSLAVRDGFTATTPEELAQARRDAERAAEAAARAAQAAARAEFLSKYGQSGPRAPGDDYPWPYELINDYGGGLSPLRYFYRECVDFVAWRLNRDVGSTSAPFRYDWSNLTPGSGGASAWRSAWINTGRPTSNVPIVGAVAWFNANHVAYVNAVNADGTVSIEEYNYGGSHAYSARTIPVSSVALFLYPPG